MEQEKKWDMGVYLPQDVDIGVNSSKRVGDAVYGNLLGGGGGATCVLSQPDQATQKRQAMLMSNMFIMTNKGYGYLYTDTLAYGGYTTAFSIDLIAN